MKSGEVMRTGLMGAVLALLLGCGSPESPYEAYSVRDSLGLQVVESHTASWSPGTGISIVEAPDVRIGAAEADEPYRFYRIADATRLSDGRILVADRGSGQVRSFGPDGMHQWSAGGLGDAPGEFRSMAGFHVMADEVTIFDPETSRLTTFSLAGGFLRTAPVSMFAATTPMAAASVKFLNDGRAFAVDATTLAGGRPPSLVRDTAFVFEVVAPGQGTPTVVASVPGMWTQHLELGGRPSYRPQPLSSEPSWDTHGDNLYLTSGDAFEFVVVNPDRGVIRLSRRTEAAPIVTEEDAQSWRDAMMARVPDAQRPMVASMLGAFTMPERLPAYAALLVDPEGFVWLRRYVAPGFTSGREWEVYSPEGAYLGPVRAPSGVDVMEIGADYVLGKWTDEVDVEYVVVHRLVRHDEED